MTEIQFLLDIVLHCKTLKEVKEKCLTRIGEVEALLTKPNIQPRMATTMQSPSTQRLLDEMPPQVIRPQATKPDRSTGTQMIDNGDGTFGKKKW